MGTRTRSHAVLDVLVILRARRVSSIAGFCLALSSCMTIRGIGFFFAVLQAPLQAVFAALSSARSERWFTDPPSAFSSLSPSARFLSRFSPSRSVRSLRPRRRSASQPLPPSVCSRVLSRKRCCRLDRHEKDAVSYGFSEEAVCERPLATTNSWEIFASSARLVSRSCGRLRQRPRAS